MRAQMSSRAASLENLLALTFHRSKCVDCPSRFGDMDVGSSSTSNMLRSSATGLFAFTCQCPFHLLWGCPDDSRRDKRCSKPLLERLSEAGQCQVQQICRACREKATQEFGSVAGARKVRLCFMMM